MGKHNQQNDAIAAAANAAAITPAITPAPVVDAALAALLAEPAAAEVDRPAVDAISAAVAALPEPIEQEHPNPYRRLFEAVNFKVTDTDTLYTDDKSGQISKKLATVFCTFRGGFAGVPGTIYGRKPKNGAIFAEFTFFGAMRQTAINPLNDQSKAELAEFKRWVGEQYALWRRSQAPVTANQKVQTGVAVEGLEF